MADYIAGLVVRVSQGAVLSAPILLRDTPGAHFGFSGVSAVAASATLPVHMPPIRVTKIERRHEVVSSQALQLTGVTNITLMMSTLPLW